jgi:hypothetical protein
MKTKLDSGTEILVLPDGKILAHNITPATAAILSLIDPQNESLKQRAAQTAKDSAVTSQLHESPKRN